MTIYKNKRDGVLYLLSMNRGGGFISPRLECTPYYEYMAGEHYNWKKVPAYKEKDFVPVATRG